MKKTDTPLPRCQPTDLQPYLTTSGETTLAAQRQRMLSALIGEQSATTIDFRQTLDIMHPAGRIKELKKLGYNIAKEWVLQETRPNKWHRVVRYTLLTIQKHGEAA